MTNYKNISTLVLMLGFVQMVFGQINTEDLSYYTGEKEYTLYGSLVKRNTSTAGQKVLIGYQSVYYAELYNEKLYKKAFKPYIQIFVEGETIGATSFANFKIDIYESDDFQKSLFSVSLAKSYDSINEHTDGAFSNSCFVKVTKDLPDIFTLRLLENLNYLR